MKLEKSSPGLLRHARKDETFIISSNYQNSVYYFDYVALRHSQSPAAPCRGAQRGTAADRRRGGGGEDENHRPPHPALGRAGGARPPNPGHHFHKQSSAGNARAR